MSNSNQYAKMSNREIRSYARESLVGNMLAPAFVAFFLFCIKNIFNMCSQGGIIGKGIPAFLFYMAMFILLNTIFGIFKYGISRYFLAFITTKHANLGEVFGGLRHSTNTILIVSFVLTIVDLICLSPYFIYGFFFAPNNMVGINITLGLYAFGNILAYLVSIMFAPIYYIICDYDEIRPTLVFILNFSIMNVRNYFKFLFLQISFIPLYILGYMSLGIGLLWVVPYVNCSYAYFYESICEEMIDKSKLNNDNKTEE